MKDDKPSFEENMASMRTPEVEVSEHMRSFRLPILNTKKSAIAGIILLILPFLFLSGVLLKHYLQVDFGILTSVYTWIGQQDQKLGDGSVVNWVIRIALTIGPLLAVFLNIAAIMHVNIEKDTKELLISIKLRWLNWTIILLCLTVVAIFGIYLLVENL